MGGRVEGLSKYEYHRSDDDLPRGGTADAWKRRWLSFWSRIGEALGELGPNQESDAAFVALLQVYAGADERGALKHPGVGEQCHTTCVQI